MHITAHGTTDIGKRRDRNEDAFLVDEDLNLFVVCDGMGGHAAGDVASRKTAEFMAEYLRDNEPALREAHATLGGYFKVVELAERATVATCRRLYELASSRPEHAGMGTTMTMLIVVDNKAVMSHVGDSRLYLLRNDELHLLSSDHTLANEMLQRGLLSPQDLDDSPYQHVLTRSVGSVQAVETELLLFDILPEDTFLLCSDGLSNYLEDSDDLTGFLHRDDLASTVSDLVELANSRGGKDNITAVIVRATADQTVGSEVEDTRTKADALQSTFLCEGISYNRLLRLVEISRIKTYRQGVSVLREREPVEGLYLIVDGRISVSRGGDKLTEFSSGECFCETALVRKRKANLSVDTLEPTTVLLLPRADFQRFIRRFPKIGRVLHTRLLEYFGRRIDGTLAAP